MATDQGHHSYGSAASMSSIRFTKASSFNVSQDLQIYATLSFTDAQILCTYRAW